MRQVIVAFERPSDCERVKEILESSGELSCLVCHSGSQVKSAVHKLHLELVVCGFKLSDESCESIYYDLPQHCVVLMVAPPTQLELCAGTDIFKLPTPARRSELLTSVRMLMQLIQHRDYAPAHRSREERELVEQAKQMLMEHSGMTEEEAHRFLQKQSMDRGARMTDTARQVLKEISAGQ